MARQLISMFGTFWGFVPVFESSCIARTNHPYRAHHRLNYDSGSFGRTRSSNSSTRRRRPGDRTTSGVSPRAKPLPGVLAHVVCDNAGCASRLYETIGVRGEPRTSAHLSQAGAHLLPIRPAPCSKGWGQHAGGERRQQKTRNGNKMEVCTEQYEMIRQAMGRYETMGMDSIRRRIRWDVTRRRRQTQLMPAELQNKNRERERERETTQEGKG